MGNFKSSVVARNEETARTEYLERQEGKKHGRHNSLKNVVILSAEPHPTDETRWILKGTQDITDE